MDTLLTILLLLGIGLAVYSALIEPRLVELRKQEVLVSRLAGHLDGYRILHISDLHIRESHRGRARALLRYARTTKPDLVVITGDLIDDDSDINFCVRFISRLKARDGIVVIFGNHDHFNYSFVDSWTLQKSGSQENDVDGLAEALRERDVHVLNNELLRLKVREEQIYIVGLDEYGEGFAQAPELFADIPNDELIVLLAHKPDTVAETQIRKPVLALAGHTHGGQIRLPGVGAIHPHTKVLDRKHNSGLVTVEGTMTHVSRGFGSSKWLPFRFLCRPEVTIITLKRI